MALRHADYDAEMTTGSGLLRQPPRVTAELSRCWAREPGLGIKEPDDQGCAGYRDPRAGRSGAAARRSRPRESTASDSVDVYTLSMQPRTYAGALRDLGIAEICLEMRGRTTIPAGGRRTARAAATGGCGRRAHAPVLPPTSSGGSPPAPAACQWSAVSMTRTRNRRPAGESGAHAREAGPPACAPTAMTTWVSRARILAVSEYVADSARRRLGLGSSRVEVVYNGVDTSVFHPRVQGRASKGLGRRWGCPPDPR